MNMPALELPAQAASLAKPSPVPALPAGPACAACGAEAVVNWRRRPTDDEFADVLAAEKARREEALLLADPQLPTPRPGPLPTAEGTTRAVYACAAHAITLEAAARIHANWCTAPNDADLPGCDCTPEPQAEAAPGVLPDASARRLPAHWQSGGA